MQIYDEIAFLDDGIQKEVSGYPIIGTCDEMSSYYGEYENIVIAIGNNAKRLKLFQQAKEIGYHLPTLLHPNATLLNAEVGEGTVIFPGVVIEPQAHIGNGCILDANSVIAHDAKLEDFVLVYANATIGANARIGRKAKISSNQSIPQNAVIKAGYTTVNSVKENDETYSFEAGV